MFNLLQKDDGSAKFTAQGGGSESAELGVEFEALDSGVSVEAAFVRGASDTDRTGIKLKRSDGTAVYLYVDTGTTLTVSTTAP